MKCRHESKNQKKIVSYNAHVVWNWCAKCGAYRKEGEQFWTYPEREK